jgi:hypothetical protein
MNDNIINNFLLVMLFLKIEVDSIPHLFKDIIETESFFVLFIILLLFEILFELFFNACKFKFPTNLISKN